MALRGSKVGQSVWVEPRKDVVLEGVILSIGAQGLRCVGTDEGFSYHTPDELNALDREVPAKAVEALEPGDTVVLFNGMLRTVAHAVQVGTPPRWRVTFEEDDKVLGIFREQTVEPGTLFRLAEA